MQAALKLFKCPRRSSAIMVLQTKGISGCHMCPVFSVLQQFVGPGGGEDDIPQHEGCCDHLYHS